MCNLQLTGVQNLSDGRLREVHKKVVLLGQKIKQNESGKYHGNCYLNLGKGFSHNTIRTHQ